MTIFKYFQTIATLEYRRYLRFLSPTIRIKEKGLQISVCSPFSFVERHHRAIAEWVWC